MAYNDIRTTRQALIAVYDNCNSLHTNAYDEANVFAVLVDAVRVCSLGQIGSTLYEVGGQYWRSM